MKLIGPRFKPAEYCRTVYQATPEPGTTLEDLLKPGFWAHVAAKLRKGDRIEVVIEDGTYFAELYVKHANKIEAHVHLMREVQLAKSQTKDEELDLAKLFPDHSIRFAAGKWRILRKEDKAILKEELKSKAEAILWLQGYLKEIAA